MPATPPSITPAPAAPQRNVKATFSDRLDAFITWLVAAVSQFGAVATNVFNNATEAFNSATAAANSAGNAATYEALALAAANSASATVGASLWVSGETVAQDAVKISPLDRRSYRRRTAAGSGTTDPANDPTNYVLVSNGPMPVLYVRDEKPGGTPGGQPTLGVWNARDLNTTKTNTIAGASVSANRVTLPAGWFDINISAPAYSGVNHFVRLFCVTDNALIEIGGFAFSGTGTVTRATAGLRRYYNSAPKVFEVQHYISGGSATTSTMGVAVNAFGLPEVYTEAEFIKVA